MYAKLERYYASTYTETEYPTLMMQRDEWRRTRPLQGVSVIDATPLCRNTIYKYLCLLDAGADLRVSLGDLGSVDATTYELLSEAGVEIIRPHEAVEPADIILDCAASRIMTPPRFGVAELTRARSELYHDASYPVFMADAGRIKRIEACLGTGESYFRAMAQLGYKEWEGKRLVLFGSGKVGQGIIYYAQKYHADLTLVTDTRSLEEGVAERVGQIIDYRETALVEAAVCEAYAVVSATGVAGSIERTLDPQPLIASSALLACMGADDEFGASFPAERVLNQRVALNFILKDPTQLKYIDATLALHNYGATYLLAHPHSVKGILEPPTELEDMLLSQTLACGSISDELRSIGVV